MGNPARINLLTFVVFNSSLGPKEGEEYKRILYYYPHTTDIDVQIKDIGLCEAVATFTDNFTTVPCQSIHTKKTRKIFLLPEKRFWIVLTVSIPTSQKEDKEAKDSNIYHEDDVHDHVYEAVLKQAYDMFCFFMGSFESILRKGTADHLKQRLQHFFTRYLPVQKWEHCDILSIFRGIHFLPLDKNTYLQIQSFLNMLESSFPSILHTVFMYNDQLVWSGLELPDMRTLYHYLTATLLPSFVEHELQSVAKSSSHVIAGSDKKFGKFVTGPPNIKDSSNLGKIPRVFVNSSLGNTEECHLVVYRALSASVCMFVRGDFEVNFEFFKLLDKFIGHQLSGLASDISELYNKKSSTNEPQYKYVYFNNMNLAQKTSIHADANKRANVSLDMMRLMTDLNSDLNGITNVEDGETIVKTINDSWVVGKKSDQREFYVVLTQKNANLIEINDEIKKLCNTHFNNIFFLD